MSVKVKKCFNDKGRDCTADCKLFVENLDDKGRVTSTECAFMSIRWISLSLAGIEETLDSLNEKLEEAVTVAPTK